MLNKTLQSHHLYTALLKLQGVRNILHHDGRQIQEEVSSGTFELQSKAKVNECVFLRR